MQDFQDRVVWVNGATGGLGGAVAQVFAEARATLVLTARDSNALTVLAQRVGLGEDRLLVRAIDSASADQVNELVSEVVRRFGRLDALINVVGGFAGGRTVAETDEALWKGQFALNVDTVFMACRGVLPQMIQQRRGAIVNIGSRAAVRPGAKVAAYAASKAAVVALTESLSAEVRDLGIHVNVILPGTIDTPRNRQDMPKADTSKWVTPREVALTLRFLASDEASGIHGAVVPVFGPT